jgi:hypothetical protein
MQAERPPARDMVPAVVPLSEFRQVASVKLKNVYSTGVMNISISSSIWWVEMEMQ